MNKKVLIVDDEEDVLRGTQLLVESLGYEALAISDPAQVLEVAERERPGVILQDLKMHNLNLAGYIASLRSDPATADIPLVFFSASPDIHQLAARHDAWGYLAKPFSEEELAQTLERILGPSQTASGRGGVRTLERDVNMVFHDFWNLISALNNYARILARSDHLDEPEQEVVESIEEVLLKLESKTDRLRSYLRGIVESPPAR